MEKSRSPSPPAFQPGSSSDVGLQAHCHTVHLYSPVAALPSYSVSLCPGFLQTSSFPNYLPQAAKGSSDSSLSPKGLSMFPCQSKGRGCKTHLQQMEQRAVTISSAHLGISAITVQTLVRLPCQRAPWPSIHQKWTHQQDSN